MGLGCGNAVFAQLSWPRKGHFGKAPLKLWDYPLSMGVRGSCFSMSDSQKFPVAAHILAYLAHADAFTPTEAVSSAVLAGSVRTNPVVVRRVTSSLAKAGLIATRAGATGGAWLLKRPEAITLDVVLEAVNGCAHLGSPPKGESNCPVGARIPKAIAVAIVEANLAAAARLADFTVLDLLTENGLAARPCPKADADMAKAERA